MFRTLVSGSLPDPGLGVPDDAEARRDEGRRVSLAAVRDGQPSEVDLISKQGLLLHRPVRDGSTPNRACFYASHRFHKRLLRRRVEGRGELSTGLDRLAEDAPVGMPFNPREEEGLVALP